MGLLVTKYIAEPAFGSVALRGLTDRDGGGDDADPRKQRFNRGRGLASIVSPAFPPERKGTTLEPLPVLAYCPDFARRAQMLLRAKAHNPGADEVSSPEGNTRGVAGGESNDRQALAALETAGLDDLAATFRRHAGAISDLAGAFLAVRTECGFHDFEKKRGSEVSLPRRSVKGGVSRR
jgi:hypothetical protein